MGLLVGSSTRTPTSCISTTAGNPTPPRWCPSVRRRGLRKGPTGATSWPGRGRPRPAGPVARGRHGDPGRAGPAPPAGGAPLSGAGGRAGGAVAPPPGPAARSPARRRSGRFVGGGARRPGGRRRRPGWRRGDPPRRRGWAGERAGRSPKRSSSSTAPGPRLAARANSSAVRLTPEGWARSRLRSSPSSAAGSGSSGSSAGTSPSRPLMTFRGRKCSRCCRRIHRSRSTSVS